MIDAKLVLSDAQAITATADSTNSIDLGAGTDCFGTARGRDAGELYLNVTVDTTMGSGNGTATLAIDLHDSADDSSYSAVADPAIGRAATAIGAYLTAGYTLLQLRLPRHLRRYIKLVYTAGTENFNAGKINAWLSREIDSRA